MRWMVAAVALVVGLASTPVGAATKEVRIVDNAFQPKAVRVRVGSSVNWTKGTTQQSHNVQQDNNLFTSGGTTPGAIDFTATFSAGRFPYHCQVHRVGGMTGIVKVPVTLLAKPPGRKFTVKWAAPATDTGTTFDVQFKIGTRKWRDWLTGTELRRAVFGKGAEPIRVRPNRRYSFRVRSRLVNAKSGWSPKRSFKT